MVRTNYWESLIEPSYLICLTRIFICIHTKHHMACIVFFCVLLCTLTRMFAYLCILIKTVITTQYDITSVFLVKKFQESQRGKQAYNVISVIVLWSVLLYCVVKWRRGWNVSLRRKSLRLVKFNLLRSWNYYVKRSFLEWNLSLSKMLKKSIFVLFCLASYHQFIQL